MQQPLEHKKKITFTSNNKTRLSLKLTLFFMRCYFKILECIAPSMAERMALRVFLTPPRNLIPDWQKPFIKNAEQSTILVNNKLIKFYRWGVGPAILLIHGWGGRGSQLSTFIDPLITAGYSVLAIDGPAHGDSSGKQTDMFEFANTINAVSTMVNSLHAIIAHSFGSACTLLASYLYKLTISKIILISWLTVSLTC